MKSRARIVWERVGYILVVGSMVSSVVGLLLPSSSSRLVPVAVIMVAVATAILERVGKSARDADDQTGPCAGQ